MVPPMDERKLRSLVEAWHARALEEDDQFTRFVFLWFCFNARLSWESKQGSDRDMIERLKRQDAGSSQLRAACDRAMRQSDTFAGHVQVLVEQSPLKKMRPVRGKGGQETSISSLDDFASILEFVYQVRCNLFLGSKSPDDSRDEKLVGACSRITESWIGCLVEGWKPSALAGGQA